MQEIYLWRRTRARPGRRRRNPRPRTCSLIQPSYCCLIFQMYFTRWNVFRVLFQIRRRYVFPVLYSAAQMKCIPCSSFWDHDSLERQKASVFLPLWFTGEWISFRFSIFHFSQRWIYFLRFNSAWNLSFQSSRLWLTWSCNDSIKNSTIRPPRLKSFP